MRIVEHKGDLAERIDILNIEADSELAKDMMELYSVKCQACQEDRLSCTVRPACKDRNFLNVLIELGVEPQNLPKFCYSQYLDQVRRYILDQRGRVMKDKRLPIKDLLSTLRVSSIRHFNSKFKKEWENYSKVNENNVMLVAGNGNIFHFDFERGIVLINPLNEAILDFNAFKLYSNLFSKWFNLDARVSDLTTNWWILTIEAKGTFSKEEIGPLKKNISRLFEVAIAKSEKDSLIVEVEAVVDNIQPPVKISSLKNLFELVAGLVEQT
ncbi:hypothetical protein EU537_02540 [Candidatus Thorarchaeota archaeon]|nr:MAG: hypothetical protein EU537_02540 [Candidatus Thorarchaeota archaeon]